MTIDRCLLYKIIKFVFKDWNSNWTIHHKFCAMLIIRFDLAFWTMYESWCHIICCNALIKKSMNFCHVTLPTLIRPDGVVLSQYFSHLSLVIYFACGPCYLANSNKSRWSGAPHVTLHKCFSHESLVIYLFVSKSYP